MGLTEVTETKETDIDAIIASVKAKYPGTRLFHAEVPHIGHFIFRPQVMADVKASAEAVDKFIEERVNSLGGQAAVEKLPIEERNRIARESDAEAGDISNLITLKRCVLHPEDFTVSVDEDKVESGIIPMLLEKILEISGWIDVEVTEV